MGEREGEKERRRIYQYLYHKQDVMVILILFPLSATLIIQGDQSVLFPWWKHAAPLLNTLIKL